MIHTTIHPKKTRRAGHFLNVDPLPVKPTGVRCGLGSIRHELTVRRLSASQTFLIFLSLNQCTRSTARWTIIFVPAADASKGFVSSPCL